MKGKNFVGGLLLLSMVMSMGVTNTVALADVNVGGVTSSNATLNNSVIGGFVGSTNRHYLQKDYNEVKSASNTSFNEVGWIGDTLNSEIVLWTGNSDVNDVSIEISDFKDFNGDVIGSENISAEFLKEVSAHVGRGFSWGNIPGSNVPREMVPDVIYSGENMSIEANRVQSVWVDIDIPRDAKPGIYNGTIKVNAKGLEAPLTFNYSFEVLNLVQPSDEESEYHLDLWQYPYTVARYYEVEPFSPEHFEILRPQMEEYKEAGGKVITTTIVEDPWNQQTYDKYPSMVDWVKKSDGTFEFDYTEFDQWVQFNLDLGIDKQINCYSIVPWSNRIIYFDEAQGKEVKITPSPGSAQWNEIWEIFFTDFIAHLDEKGWFDLAYIAMDERGMNDMRAAVDLIHTLPNKDGNFLKISGAMNYNQLGEGFLDQIDDISINLGHINNNNDTLRKLADHRRELGLNTTMYTCVGDYPSSFTRSMPSESEWTIWYAASQNTDGFLRWAYDAWVENPLESVDHWYWESGDPFYVYPGDKENPEPRTSPRFEKLKEGIRDIEKVQYLKKAYPEVEAELDELLLTIQRPYGKGNAWGAMESGSKANDDLISNEVDRLKNGLMDISKKIFYSNGEIPKLKGIKAKALNSTEVKLTWNIPTNTGIEEFVIYKDGKEYSRVAGDVSELVIDGLKANNIYSFKVTAVSWEDKISSPKSVSVRTKR